MTFALRVFQLEREHAEFAPYSLKLQRRAHRGIDYPKQERFVVSNLMASNRFTVRTLGKRTLDGDASRIRSRDYAGP